MDRTGSTESQCLYKGAYYLYLYHPENFSFTILRVIYLMTEIAAYNDDVKWIDRLLVV